MHASRWTGVWLSDRPPEAHDRVCGIAVLLVHIPAEQATALTAWEWVEADRSHREWLVPTAFLDAHATVALAPGSALDAARRIAIEGDAAPEAPRDEP